MWCNVKILCIKCCILCIYVGALVSLGYLAFVKCRLSKYCQSLVQAVPISAKPCTYFLSFNKMYKIYILLCSSLVSGIQQELLRTLFSWYICYVFMLLVMPFWAGHYNIYIYIIYYSIYILYCYILFCQNVQCTSGCNFNKLFLTYNYAVLQSGMSMPTCQVNTTLCCNTQLQDNVSFARLIRPPCRRSQNMRFLL